MGTGMPTRSTATARGGCGGPAGPPVRDVSRAAFDPIVGPWAQACVARTSHMAVGAGSPVFRCLPLSVARYPCSYLCPPLW